MKQGSSIGLVNITQVFTPNYEELPDGTSLLIDITVENSGTDGPDDPEWKITGSAVPVNAAKTRLSVSFSGAPSTDEPGNYWILDYAPDYSWAIVSDPGGTSGTIITRDRFPTETEVNYDYDALVARAYRLGVKGTITPTAQYPTP